MTDCFFTVSLRTVNSIMTITDLFSASTVRNISILSKFIITFKNVIFVLFQSTVIVIACLKTVFSHIAVSIVILNIQLDLLNTEFVKNN